MTLDDLTRTALIRGATAFAVVLVVGSTAVYTSARLRGGSEGAPSPTPVSPSPAQPPVTATPEAWLAWVPGGLPDGFGASITAIPAIANTTTATADIAWLTGSSDARGRPVDQPVAPYMIPIDTTGVEPGFASFLPQPERRVVAGLNPRQGILSESAAKLRHLGIGSTLTFSTGVDVTIVGTLPDVLMGDYELLVDRATADRIGVTHERYVLFQKRAYAHPSAEQLAQRFIPYLPIDVPYPVVEVRAPGETRYLRANDREAPPIVLKERFGEFDAHPDPTKAGALTIDPAWVQTHIASEDLPVLHTVTCDTEVLDLLRRAMNQLASAGHSSDVSSAGTCYVPVADPTDPDGPLTAKAFGAAIELNRGTNLPGTAPEQTKTLIATMARWGFGWAGRDAYPQGGLFRFRVLSVPRD